MNMHSTSLRYARALFSLSTASDSLSGWLGDLEEFVQLLNESPATNHFFSSPFINLKEKEIILMKHFKERFDVQLLKFFLTLIRKKRFGYLAEIAKAFRQMVIETQGVIEGRLITSTPLDDSTKQQIAATWGNFYGKKLEIKEELDPKLLGGGILIIANKLIDFSVKGSLNRLKRNLNAIKT